MHHQEIVELVNVASGKVAAIAVNHVKRPAENRDDQTP